MITNSYYHANVFRSCSGLKPQNLFSLLILSWLLKVCSCRVLEPESPLATDTVVKVSGTVSFCCCSKLRQVQWLQTSQICFLILDVRSPERCRQGCIPFLETLGENLFLLLLAYQQPPTFIDLWSLPLPSKPAAEHLQIFL